ncbi:hypothetical protein CQW23_14229 [Capsicum baccatum]|uniref:Uncharacterized protein n=1 Tax=Capsicum baccatum TaxID=33114 RepID=A0A2G2WIK7_CAPBA|nr:hypothetical protein CQW23_14229 [Capsicum baccatum]
MPFFLTLRSVQILSDPKVIDGIKMKLFGATTITRKIILEGGFVAVDDCSRSGSGNAAAIGANDAPLTVFETTSHYDYDHSGCTDFSSNFSTSSECSACKLEATAEDHNITVDNPSTASKEEEKIEPVSSGERKNYPFEGNCSPFAAAYAEYLSDGLQVPNDGLDAGLLRKRYVALLWKYGEVKAQNSYASDIKDPQLPKPNSVTSNEEQPVHID